MIRLCAIAAIEENGCKEFIIDDVKLFAVKKNAQVFVYLNRCPHQGISLNWQPDVFLDYDKLLIQCATHGAKFLIDTGECIAGPCLGKQLSAIPYTEIKGEIFIELSALQF